jgi:hypothetical protein
MTPSCILVDEYDGDCRIDFDRGDSCGTNALATNADCGSLSKPTAKISKDNVATQIPRCRSGLAPLDRFGNEDSIVRVG